MNTYIIIVTYNGMQWIETCLKSIPAGLKTIIVDNNSTDGTPAFIKEQFAHCHLMEETKNLGFGQANNKGIAHALKENADAVFLLNQDAYINADCIDQLELTYKASSGYGILSPIHLDATGKKLDRQFSYYMDYDSNTSFYSDAILKDLKFIYEVPFVNAAGWFIPKSTLQKIGGFDPLFFHYGEDNNYCQRLKYHELKIGVVPNAFMIHDRENRKEQTIQAYSPEAIEKRLRKIKYQVANINLPDGEQILLAKLNEMQRAKLKHTLLWNIQKRSYFTQLFDRLKEEQPAILESRKLNKEKGAHYL